MNIILPLDYFVIYLFAGIFGLIIGSFLSVVITRYPQILRQQWRTECHEFLELPDASKSEKISLALPKSHCPQCKMPLKFYHNIPLFSYLWLRGKCAFCQCRIPIIYPLIELLTCMLSLAVLWRFGISWTTLAALLFTYTLIAMCFIDFQHQFLPDTITLPLLWIGLMLNSIDLFTNLFDALWATVFGYLILWSVMWLFFHLRHKQGMGHGDFKMMAAVGAWVGLNGMLNTLLLAVVTGALLSLLLMALRRVSWSRPIPFGPFIGFAGWITLMAGPFILQGLQRIPL